MLALYAIALVVKTGRTGLKGKGTAANNLILSRDRKGSEAGFCFERSMYFLVITPPRDLLE